MKEQKTLLEQIGAFMAGKYDEVDTDTQISAGWYDWFCKDSALAGKTKALYAKVISIMKSKKFDPSKVYIFFKNNCPGVGRLYDSFSICDIHTGNVLFWVTPKSGHTVYNNEAQVCGPENKFEKPLAHGSWVDIKGFFLN